MPNRRRLSKALWLQGAVAHRPSPFLEACVIVLSSHRRFPSSYNLDAAYLVSFLDVIHLLTLILSFLLSNIRTSLPLF